MPTREEVVEALHQVEDPELGMDIVDLGLLYDVDVEGPKVKISYSLTSMGCPAGAMIQEDIDRVVRELPGVEEVESEVTFEPPWTRTGCPRTRSSSSASEPQRSTLSSSQRSSTRSTSASAVSAAVPLSITGTPLASAAHEDQLLELADPVDPVEVLLQRADAAAMAVTDGEVGAVLLDVRDAQDGVDEQRAVDLGGDQPGHEVDALDHHRPALGQRPLDRRLDADEDAGASAR